MSNSTEGKSQHVRIDALEKVTGRAKYVEDLPDLPGLAFLKPLGR